MADVWPAHRSHLATVRESDWSLKGKSQRGAEDSGSVRGDGFRHSVRSSPQKHSYLYLPWLRLFDDHITGGPSEHSRKSVNQGFRLFEVIQSLTKPSRNCEEKRYQKMLHDFSFPASKVRDCKLTSKTTSDNSLHKTVNATCIFFSVVCLINQTQICLESGFIMEGTLALKSCNVFKVSNNENKKN